MIPCPAGCYDGIDGYDRRKRPAACKKCGGKGVVNVDQPRKAA